MTYKHEGLNGTIEIIDNMVVIHRQQLGFNHKLEETCRISFEDIKEVRFKTASSLVMGYILILKKDDPEIIHNFINERLQKYAIDITHKKDNEHALEFISVLEKQNIIIK